MQFFELSVYIASIRGVCHNDFVQNELFDDIFVNSVLLKFEIIVVDGLTLNNLVIVLRVIQLLQERMLEHFFGTEPLLRIVCEELLH